MGVEWLLIWVVIMKGKEKVSICLYWGAEIVSNLLDIVAYFRSIHIFFIQLKRTFIRFIGQFPAWLAVSTPVCITELPHSASVKVQENYRYYSYTILTQIYLPFHVVIDSDEPEWLLATNSSGQRGLVPANYIQLL